MQSVVQHPATVWGVGPLFAAVTGACSCLLIFWQVRMAIGAAMADVVCLRSAGVAFKEGLCYGESTCVLKDVINLEFCRVTLTLHHYGGHCCP